MPTKTGTPLAPRLLAAVMTAGIVSLAAGWCSAAITGITVNNQPACVGTGVTLTAVEDGKTAGMPSQAFYWEQRCIEKGCAGNWLTLNGVTGQVITSGSAERGTREYRVTRSYSTMTNIIQSSATVQVTWIPPQSIALTLGDQTPAQNCSTVRLEFTLSCLPGVFTGLIEEKIWRNGQESEWTATGPNFYFEFGKIVDIKQSCITPVGAWANMPPGVYDTFDQKIRMTVHDCCNQPGPPILFQKKRFVREKLPTGEWQIRFIADVP